MGDARGRMVGEKVTVGMINRILKQRAWRSSGEPKMAPLLSERARVSDVEHAQ